MNEHAVLPHVIVTDDDEDLREMVSDYLAGQGFSVRGVASGAALDAALCERPADLLIIDLNLPAEDGFSIARRIRAGSAVPIIMLTGASDVVDRVVGLEMGADDYVTKPFDLRELKARIRAVLRRGATQPAEPAAPPAPVAGKGLVAFGRAHLDLEGHCLILEGGTRETLTAMEFDLLRVLAQHPNRVLSRDRLLDLAHNRDNEPFDRSIDVRITRLRKKIEADPAKPATIKTIRGVGYMFVTNRGT
ncbi:response regulator [Shinella sp. CPCC 101442]|uniref:response regulator n=1 Tax=Shinella sp. CPCC 101442 TaxID=2932265 RepID=UPI002152ECF9|nr:response regulator [Shinella sp. CPCC 101442]